MGEYLDVAGSARDVFTVGGKPVLVSPGNQTTPSNLRIWDINPTKTKDEEYSYVTFRWNFDNLQAGVVNTTTCEVDVESFDGEDIALSEGNCVGKEIYFTSSGNSYTITGVSGPSAGKYTLTIQGSLSSGADVTSQASPARIIDKYVTEYRFTIRNIENGFTRTRLLDKNFVKHPEFTEKLELGEVWTVSIQGGNVAEMGPIVSMPSGSFQPDKIGGHQDVINYSSNFLNQLPPITPEGSMTMRPDGQGFELSVSGWSAEGDPTNTAHEFEIIYSAKHTLSESNFNNLVEGEVFHTINRSKNVHISSGRPTKYSVGVRPLQNKQPVAPAVFGEVTSGGGGVMPTEQILAEVFVDINVLQIEVKSVDGENLEIEWQSPTPDFTASTPIRPNFNIGTGRTLTKSDGSDWYIKWHKVVPDITPIDTIAVPNLTGAVTSDIYKIGVSEKDRHILDRSLDVDMIVTKLEFNIKSASGTSPEHPGIIRVYQKGLSSSATTMEVEGYRPEGTIVQTASLPIRTASDGTRVMVIDAFDPDRTGTGAPNNDCEFSGTLTVVGRPLVIDNF